MPANIHRIKMRIAIINRSDLNGGAAVFSYRLLKALRSQDIDAKMLVTEKLSDSDDVLRYASPICDRYAFLAERLQIFLQNGFSRKNLFKVDTADFGRDISKHPIVKNADVIILNWINQGAVSLNCVKKLCDSGKPVIWNMHDMWECTGICHHAYECERYKDACGECIYLRSNNEKDLSHKSWLKKKAIFSSKNLHFVAVSNWLARKCRESSLLGDKNVTVIPNTIAVEEFSFNRRRNIDMEIPDNRKIITMGAARLDDPVKGFPILLGALKWLKAHKPEIAENLHLLLFGGIRDASLLLEIDLPFTYLGRIDEKRVKEVLSHTDVILSSSLYESFGGTLIEGMAAGCIPVTFGNGGQGDIVNHLQTGYIAKYKSCEDFANGIEWAVNSGIDRAFLHETAEKRFAPPIIVDKYLRLITEVI